MHDFILNIDNKEILIEILHHSIDYLTGSVSKEQRSTKFSHKFGFSNADEFEAAVKFIAQLYRQFTLRQVNDTELICYFAHLNPDLQQSVADVIAVRRSEVEEFLVAEFNARDARLMTSFDWDVKWVMGTSALATLRQPLATLVLVCRKREADGGCSSSSSISMEMTPAMVKKMIGVLEECERKLETATSRGDGDFDEQQRQKENKAAAATSGVDVSSKSTDASADVVVVQS